MPIERDDTEERLARLNCMIAEFRAARHRRLVKQGMAVWKRAEAEMEHRAFDAKPATTPTKH